MRKNASKLQIITDIHTLLYLFCNLSQYAIQLMSLTCSFIKMYTAGCFGSFTQIEPNTHRHQFYHESLIVDLCVNDRICFCRTQLQVTIIRKDTFRWGFQCWHVPNLRALLLTLN